MAKSLITEPLVSRRVLKASYSTPSFYWGNHVQRVTQRIFGHFKDKTLTQFWVFGVFFLLLSFICFVFAVVSFLNCEMGISIFMPCKVVSKKDSDTQHFMYVLGVCENSPVCHLIRSSQEPVKGIGLRGDEWPALDSKAALSCNPLSLLGLRRL